MHCKVHTEVWFQALWHTEHLVIIHPSLDNNLEQAQVHDVDLHVF